MAMGVDDPESVTGIKLSDFMVKTIRVIEAAGQQGLTVADIHKKMKASSIGSMSNRLRTLAQGGWVLRYGAKETTGGIHYIYTVDRSKWGK